jgi:hypothetical protein
LKFPPHSAMHTFTIYLIFNATRWRVPAVTGNGSPYEILPIYLAQENQEMYPKTHSGKLSKNKMPGSVQQWILVALVKNTSLHFDCLKTTDGLAWAGYKITHIHSDIVCLLIQSNCIELQRSINILIWVAWLFSHSVLTLYLNICGLFNDTDSSSDYFSSDDMMIKEWGYGRKDRGLI